MTNKIGTKIIVTDALARLHICQKMRQQGCSPDAAGEGYSAVSDPS